MRSGTRGGGGGRGRGRDLNRMKLHRIGPSLTRPMISFWISSGRSRNPALLEVAEDGRLIVESMVESMAGSMVALKVVVG